MNTYDVEVQVTRTIKATVMLPVTANSFGEAEGLVNSMVAVLDLSDLQSNADPLGADVCCIVSMNRASPARAGTAPSTTTTFPPAYVPPAPGTDGYQAIRIERVVVD